MYKQQFIVNLIVSIFGILFGLLLCFTEAEDFLRFVFGAIALFLFLQAIPSLISISRYNNKKEQTKVMINGITMIVLGVILLLFPTTIATIIAGAILLIIPIYNIVTSYNKKESLKKEAIKLVLGLVMILCGVGAIVKVVLYIVGGLIIAISVAYFVYTLITYIKTLKKEKKEQEENEVIDV